jgi:hypothetical protein
MYVCMYVYMHLDSGSVLGRAGQDLPHALSVPRQVEGLRELPIATQHNIHTYIHTYKQREGQIGIHIYTYISIYTYINI